MSEKRLSNLSDEEAVRQARRYGQPIVNNCGRPGRRSWKPMRSICCIDPILYCPFPFEDGARLLKAQPQPILVVSPLST